MDRIIIFAAGFALGVMLGTQIAKAGDISWIDPGPDQFRSTSTHYMSKQEIREACRRDPALDMCQQEAKFWSCPTNHPIMIFAANTDPICISGYIPATRAKSEAR